MDQQSTHNPSCPFCPFSDSDDKFVAEHIEYCHPEGGMQHKSENGELAVDIYQPDSSDKENHTEKYIDCPHDCGEVVAAVELSTHLDLHFAEEIAFEDTSSVQPGSHSLASNTRDIDIPDNDYYYGGDGIAQDLLKSLGKDQSLGKKIPRGPSNKDRERSPPTRATNLNTTLTGGVKRLGRSELGPHAHEKRMPSWLRKMLEKGAKATQSNKISSDGKLVRQETVENETPDVIPVLARLCEQDKSVQRAFFCTPNVRQVFKMQREGGFCGYRNIQMLVSYIQLSSAPGHDHFLGASPTILQLQDMIENAWDMGFNSVGRVETGGIRGTRKYIGTQEAQALFLSLGIPCEANSIGESKEMRAHDALYTHIATYFRRACSLDGDDKVFVTNLPPIYFQHKGHSMTIIGFEIRDNGSANLLVFDPMFKTPPAVNRLRGTRAISPDPARILKAYRRGGAYLQKYKIFEILKLSIPETLPQNEEAHPIPVSSKDDLAM